MNSKLTLKTSVLFALATAAAAAGPIVYTVNLAQQFGAVDLSTGAFKQIGPNIPEGSNGLVAGTDGKLLTLSFASNLYSIDSSMGAATLIGPTGLGDCTTPASPCGPTSSLTFGGSAGNVYATDFRNNLYRVNAQTGAATLIGATGIPVIPYIPGSSNPDGTLNFYDEAIFGGGGTLYATFDAWVFDPGSFSVRNVAVSPALYRIDTSSGLATLIGPTDLAITSVVGVNGTYYAFDGITAQVTTLDLTNGNTSAIVGFDPALAPILGAAVAPVPEPATVLFVGFGLACIGLSRRRRRISLMVGRERRSMVKLPTP